MLTTINCLDHGFVKLRNISGPTRREPLYDVDEGVDEPILVGNFFDANDIDPANTARISFNQHDKQRTEELDHKLYEYLISHHHNTPVEMIETWWEVKLPILLARQFVRHRTACINEVSARYATLPEEWYIPEIVGGKAKSNKQGQEDNLQDWQQLNFREALNGQCKHSYELYTYYLSIGVAPEHARLFLHMNHYTHWVWKCDLHNLMHFLALRLDSHAQVEARIYAEAKYNLLKQFLPKSMKFFDTYRRFSSVEEKELLQIVLSNGNKTLSKDQQEKFSRLRKRLEKGTI
jgi:thymidylate synthase (FAD)